MVSSIRDLVHLRWRVAQLILAMVTSDGPTARSVREAMRVEGITDRDMVEEFRLLIAQFGRRPASALAGEVARVGRQLLSLCTRCGHRSRHLDNDGVCWRCIIDEPPR